MRKSALSFIGNLMMQDSKSSLRYRHMYIKINFRVIGTYLSVTENKGIDVFD